MASETQPDQIPVTYIKCNCGNKAFIPAWHLSPGEKQPTKLKKVWICAGCGMQFFTEDFPKPSEAETRHESKLILPDNKKLKLIQ